MATNHLNFFFASLPRRYGLLVCIWSVLTGGSLLWALHQEAHNTLSVAAAAADANINKDLGFRRWATSHGGVYVSPTEHTPPNPYLKLPDRDVVTTTGKELTLMNPAYVLRELQTDFPGEYGVKSRITSLKPINPINAPDDWEAEALRAFERGEKERQEVQQIEGKAYLRLMKPLITEPGCLKCHAFQGYKVGDIRGGLSTAVPLAVYMARGKELRVNLSLTHGAIWLIGLAGLGFSYRRDRKVFTERKRAEDVLREKEERLALATFHNGVGIWDWNLRTQEMIWDDSMYALYRIRREDFIGTEEAWRAALHPDDLARGDQEVADAIAGKKPFETEFRVIWPDGEVRYIKAVAKVFRDDQGVPMRMLGINMDVTDRRKAEIGLGELNRDLEQRVTERTAQLEAANKELEAFSYSVSHDLRTPLRAIDGFSHILLDDYAGKLDEEGKRLLNVVRDNTSRMGQLIDDILKFSRAGRLEMTFAEIDMERLAREVVEELQPSVDSSKLQLEIEHIPLARGNRAMMRQVFVNLFSNAIKFSSTREVVRIKVGGSVEGGEAVYYVKDNGVGFDMQYAGKLFGVFQRLHGVTEFEGTGIGLAIVKRIITRHGGRVWAEGEVNEGATIHFALPIKEADHGRHGERS